MNKLIVIKEIRLGPLHKPTGNTYHGDGQNELPQTALLIIAKYFDFNGFYLIHYDNDENEITDTFHETVDDAIAQAEWEYGIRAGEWNKIG